MQELTIHGEAIAPSLEAALEAELFLQDNYLFRRNMLNGKIEFATLPAEVPVYRTLTQEALNSIIIHAKKEDICDGKPKTDILELIHSEAVPTFNPIQDFLEHLPQWDGQNHVAKLFGRLPGISTEQHGFLAVWLRSTVAHWLQMDTIHGNECVPTLIGAQGCGKTTFVTRLLPPHLREYFLDHLNLSNKFDKEMALTNNLLVNLDELEAIRPSQHAHLKQTLSKSKVNGDATGSRRYICLTIPKGQLIDNEGEIDYEQLYAQVLYEIRELKVPYWFNNVEVARIQELNLNYMEQKDISEMIQVCFRKPKEGENAKKLDSRQILEFIQQEYPSVKSDRSTKIHLGLAMKDLGIEHLLYNNRPHYLVVPLKSA